MADSVRRESLPAPAPTSPIDDLDEQLEAVFDGPSSPAEVIPQSPPSKPEPPAEATATTNAVDPPRRTILDALVAQQHRLTGTAAQIAAEVSALAKPAPGFSAGPTRVPIAQAMMQRRSSKSAQSASEAARDEAKRRKRARNAFKVIGRDRLGTAPGKDTSKMYAFVDNRFTNMALREAPFPQDALQALFEHCVRVDISEITKRDDEMRAGKLGEYVVFGCLVKKHAKRETKGGGKYAVWSMCNMPRGNLPGADEKPKPTLVTVLLFDEAFQAFHTQVEGSVFAMRKPSLLPPRGTDSAASEFRRANADWSGHCLRVSKEDYVVRLGICKDFKLCEAGGPNLSVCGAWYDANSLQQCAHHSRKRRKKLTHGTRMDVNNAERPGLSKETFHNLDDPNDISRPGGSTGRNSAHHEKLDRADDEARHKREEDRRRLAKLKASTSTRSKAETLSQVRGRSKDQQSRLRTAPYVANKSTSIVQAAMRQRRHDKIGKNGSWQTRYDQGVHLLLGCGFTLGPDGSLVPPPSNALVKKNITLKRGKASRTQQRNAENSAKAIVEDETVKNFVAPKGVSETNASDPGHENKTTTPGPTKGLGGSLPGQSCYARLNLAPTGASDVAQPDKGNDLTPLARIEGEGDEHGLQCDNSPVTPKAKGASATVPVNADNSARAVKEPKVEEETGIVPSSNDVTMVELSDESEDESTG